MSSEYKKAESKKKYRQKQEQRLAEQSQIIREQAERISQLEKQNLQLKENYETISNSICWKITKPVRFTLDVIKWSARIPRKAGLLKKGLYSLRYNGPRATWHKAVDKINSNNIAQTVKYPLFSDEELALQREHTFTQKIRFSIVVPLYNTPARFLREMIKSVLAQSYTDWELCMADGSGPWHGAVRRICQKYMQQDNRIRYEKLEKNLGISGNTNACLAMATGDYIGLLDHDDLLHPAALYEVMRTIENTGADFIYTDEAVFESPDIKNITTIHFKPDYAPDNLRANNYICHFTVFKRALLETVGSFDAGCDGSQDHDMILRLTENARRVAHIPEVLYYWRSHAGSVAESPGVKPYVFKAGVRAVEKQLERLGLEGSAAPVQPGQPIYRIRYAVKGTPKVSILIVNHEGIENIKKCLNSVFEKTTWPNYEIVIVENENSPRDIFSEYKKLQRNHENMRVVTWGKKENSSKTNNYGAQFCTGEYLLLLSNDTEVITPDWIQEMIMLAQREDVGAVGAMLYYPDDTIRHAGVCLGMGEVAGDFFQHVEKDNTGYMGRLLYAQNVSSVAASCMLLRRDVWEKLGGLNKSWSAPFNGTDLCLRIRQAGYLIAWTPFAKLYQSDSTVLESCPPPKKNQKRLEREVLRFKTQWAKELEAGDPYFNPNFALDRSDFYIKPDLQRHDAR